LKVCVIGMGYIGFPTACLIAGAGHQVIGVDNNAETVHLLNNGDLHIKNEKGLYELSQEVLHKGMLRVKEKPEEADVFVIAVPTPCELSDGSLKTADLSYVRKAAAGIVPYLEKGNLVVLESTVPPGTTETIVGGELEKGGFKPGEDIHLVVAPERVLPGNIMEELVHNDRLIGGVNEASAKAAEMFYATFVKGPIYLCHSRTAEMAKLMENTFRDVNIALANELALLAEIAGVNSYEAIELANNHPRVNILKPGPGVGGHCIAEDPWFLIGISPEHASLLKMARNINAQMPAHVLKLFQGLKESHAIKKVAVLGASYKANVGDARNSPGLHIAELIRPFSEELVVHDPYLKDYSGEITEVLKDKDLFILTTDHDVYREQLRPAEAGSVMRNRVAIDTRGFLDERWDEHFKVVRLGVGY